MLTPKRIAAVAAAVAAIGAFVTAAIFVGAWALRDADSVPDPPPTRPPVSPSRRLTHTERAVSRGHTVRVRARSAGGGCCRAWPGAGAPLRNGPAASPRS